MSELKTCEICGKPTTNALGVCARSGQPECKRENKHRWYEAHREANLEYNRRWRKINRDVLLKASRRAYAANREGIREAQRRLYAASSHDDLTYLRYSPGLGLHKIGHTKNLKVNHQALRRGCPDIQLVATFPHGLELERWLKDYFQATRIKGTEWFSGLTEAAVKQAVTEYEATLSAIRGSLTFETS